MWILLTILALALVILIWVLFAPMVLCIDSFQHRYYVSVGRLMKIEPLVDQDQVLLRISLPFYRFNINPNQQRKQAQKADDPPEVKKKTGPRMKPSFYFNRVMEVLRTFSVRHLVVDIDTGNFTTNAKLTPVVWLLNQGHGRFQLNYHGDVNLWIEIENRLVRMVPIVFKFIKAKYFRT
jgi:hypothetical protein